MFDHFQKDLTPTDLEGWRRAVLSETSPSFQASWDVCLEVWAEAEAASARRTTAPHIPVHGRKSAEMLEHCPVWPYGGALEEALGPGVWTDGLHIWVAQSTVAELRHADLVDTDAGLPSGNRLRSALLANARYLATCQQEDEAPASPHAHGVTPVRAWSQVRDRLREVAPDLLEKLPERSATDEDVRAFQKTVRQPSSEDVAALHAWSAASWAPRPPLVEGFPLSAEYARRCGWLGDLVAEAIQANDASAPALWDGWMLADHARHDWSRKGDQRSALLLSTLSDQAKLAYLNQIQETARTHPCFTEPLRASLIGTLSNTVAHQNAVLTPWTKAVAALRDSTPETETADRERWYRAFLTETGLEPEEHAAWASLAPASPEWRGAPRWWTERLSEQGLMFLLQQKGPVPDRILESQRLLMSGAETEKTTPLIRASQLDATGETVQGLLSNGPAIDATNAAGETALFHAHAGEAVRLLLAAGASVNHASKDGATPLHAAFESADAPPRPGLAPVWKVDQLLAAGANPRACDKRGETPLHALVLRPFSANGLHRLHALVNAGADPLARDAGGQTPLDVVWGNTRPGNPSESWVGAWLNLPALSLKSLPLEDARALRERLLDAPTKQPEKLHPLLQAWWIPFGAAQEAGHMDTALPSPARTSARVRM